MDQLDRLRQDMEDSSPFIREMLGVIWRINSINIMMIDFVSELEDIDESTSNEDRAAAFGRAIEGIDLSTAMEDLSICESTIVEVAESIFRQWTEDLEGFGQYVALSDLDEIVEFHCGRLRQAMQSERESLQKIQRHCMQLRDHHPRYEEIMNRTGFLDMVVGFAAGWFAGPLGVAGMQIWGNWREKTDEEFIHVYGAAVDNFVEACQRFCRATEERLESVMSSLDSEHTEIYERAIAGLSRAVAEGLSIEPVVKRLTEPTPGESMDEDGREFMEIIFENLREEGYPASAERRMRRQVGL